MRATAARHAVEVRERALAVEAEKLALLAVEVWRLGQRLDASDLSRDRLADSYRRLRIVLEQAGVHFTDPTGTSYTDGMNAEVIATPDGTGDTSDDGLTITQVLRPAVFMEDVCIVAPQVVLGRAPAGGGA